MVTIFSNFRNHLFQAAVQQQNLYNKPECLQASKVSENTNKAKSISLPVSRHINDVISSSTEEDEDNQRHNKNRNSENANIIANNKNAVNVRKGSLSSINSRNIAQSKNPQMSPPTSQTKSISKHTASKNLNLRNSAENGRPVSSSHIALDNSNLALSKAGGTHSLVSSPRSSSLSHRKKSNGIATDEKYILTPTKGKKEYISRSKTPDKGIKKALEGDPGDTNKNINRAETSTNIATSEGKILLDDSCSGRSSRCDDETDEVDDPSSPETESNNTQPSLEVNNRRNYRRVQNRKPRSSRKGTIGGGKILTDNVKENNPSKSNTIPMTNLNVALAGKPKTANMTNPKQISTPSRKANKSISSAESAMSKYAPEKYASDSGQSPRSSNLQSSKRTLSVSGASNTYKRPNSSKPGFGLKSNKISSSTTASPMRNRPTSAVPNMSGQDKRPRANTMSTSLVSDKPFTSSPSRNEISNKKKSQQRDSVKNAEIVEPQKAATIIQTQWRGHATRNNDPKVVELKEEVRNLRTEQHIRHLTKELSAAKSALEQERKLRALQMDAIKVLWKEVQMLDANRSENATLGVGGVNTPSNRPRPSGSSGSKISSRSSEHSIAKLMETLEATAGTGCNTSLPITTDHNVPETTGSMSLSVTGNITAGNMTTPSSSDSPVPGSNSDKYHMAQSMPASMLMGQLDGDNVVAPNSSCTSHQQPPQAIDALNRTCSSLQNQVEQLQSSLTGVMQFMSAFSSLEVSEMTQNKVRTRHSSSGTSTQETVSYPCQNNSVMSASMINPSTSFAQSSNYFSKGITPSVRSDEATSSQMSSINTLIQEPISIKSTQSENIETNDDSSVTTTKEAIKYPTPAINLVTSKVNEQSYDSGILNSDSVIDVGTSDCGNKYFSLQPKDESNNIAPETNTTNRPVSPRPKTLPGLNQNGKENIPGLVQLAGNALLNSPQAPQQVKAFAKTLVEGLLSDSIVNKEEDEGDANDMDKVKDSSNLTSEMDEEGTAGCDDMTDVSLSLATEATETQNLEVVPSEHLPK